MATCTTNKAACGIETIVLSQLIQMTIPCTTNKAACGIETPVLRKMNSPFWTCTTNKAACGIETTIPILENPTKPYLHHKQSRVRH